MSWVLLHKINKTESASDSKNDVRICGSLMFVVVLINGQVLQRLREYSTVPGSN